MSHWKGYRVVLLNQNGDEIYRFQEARNMQRQLPNGNLVIGNALDGVIGDFYLCESGNNIPMEPELFENCLVRTSFTADKIYNDTLVINNGTAGDLNITAKGEFVLK